VITVDKDRIGETGDPSSDDLAHSNRDVLVDDNDSVEHEA